MSKVYVVIKTESGINAEPIVTRSYDKAVEKFKKLAKEMDSELSDSELEDIVEQEYFDYADDGITLHEANMD